MKRIERNKRKYVTSVFGLEAFGMDLKKVRPDAQVRVEELGANRLMAQVAKEFGKKFATGSSVSKVPSGGEEIVVQGDLSGQIEDFLLDKYKNIPADNIELVDDKKNKKDAAAAAGGGAS